MKQFFDCLEIMSDIEIYFIRDWDLLINILKLADVIYFLYDFENMFSCIPLKALSWGNDARTSLVYSIKKLE